MCVFIRGKIVVTDAKIYEFADHSLAEKFINCLVNMDEISSCKQVPAVHISAKPIDTFSNRWDKVFYIFQKVSGRAT
jgi:hypothetical protein